jgi:hypothetical protein
MGCELAGKPPMLGLELEHNRASQPDKKARSVLPRALRKEPAG